MVHIPQLLHLTTIQFSLSLLIPYLGFSMLEAFHLWKKSKGIFALQTESAYMHHKRCVYTAAWKVNVHSCAQWTEKKMLIAISVKFKVTLMCILHILCIFMHMLQRAVYISGRMQIYQNRQLNRTSWKSFGFNIFRKKRLFSKKNRL